MNKCTFIVNLKPIDAMNIIKEQQNAELVYEELNPIGDGKYCGTLLFEKYFVRVSNRAALMVTINNLNEKTIVTSVATGSSTGIFFNFDWGASEDFSNSVRDILKEYIISDVEQ
ncbi:hypothetical protein IAI10_13550 [Clostridium sp. 19966]|uniref:DUF6054 family protein n=1 Tax=Clostridium sp. 19966 TaxID=2768166 RepID=UPI0028DDDED2|nr:DUF6054 family protein [Clostridium sp. 19966]MDT8717689.1 hypothetical protein [Clostridium sp. 19966]